MIYGTENFGPAMEIVVKGGAARNTKWPHGSFIFLARKGISFKDNYLLTTMDVKLENPDEEVPTEDIIKYYEKGKLTTWMPKTNELISAWHTQEPYTPDRSYISKQEGIRRKEMWPELMRSGKVTIIHSLTPPSVEGLEDNKLYCWIKTNTDGHDTEEAYTLENGNWKQLVFNDTSETLQEMAEKHPSFKEILEKYNTAIDGEELPVLENGIYNLVVSDEVPSKKDLSTLWLNKSTLELKVFEMLDETWVDVTGISFHIDEPTRFDDIDDDEYFPGPDSDDEILYKFVEFIEDKLQTAAEKVKRFFK